MQLFLVAQNNTRKARTVSSLPPGASFISVRGSPWSGTWALFPNVSRPVRDKANLSVRLTAPPCSPALV